MIDLINKTPGELANLRLELADWFSKAGEQKVGLMRMHAEYFSAHRAEFKSDTALERAWEMTDEGLLLMELREKMRSLEHKLSAIKSLLDTRNFEARSQY